jgi:Zn finger protein HypA/HybF involved in hydrogenase expression
MSQVKLITCGDTWEAHIIKDKLQNEGIRCFLTNQNFTNLMPHFNGVMGAGIQVFVREVDLENARQLIRDKLEPENEEIICPHCRSKDIKLGLGKLKGLKIFNVIIALLCVLPFGNLKPKYFCNQCKEEIK